MTIAFINDAKASNVFTNQTGPTVYGLTHSVVVPTVYAGNTLVVAVSVGGNTNGVSISISDSKGQSWTKVADVDPPAGSEAKRLVVFMATNVAAGSTTINVSGPANAYLSMSLAVQQVADIATSGALDVTATSIDSGFLRDHPISAATNTAQANEIVFVAYASSKDQKTSPLPLFDVPGFQNLTIQFGAQTTVDQAYNSVLLASKVLSTVQKPSASVTTAQAGNQSGTTDPMYDKGSLVLFTLKAAAPVTTAPSAPSTISAYGGDGRASVSFAASPTAKSYKVYRSATQNGTYVQVGTTTQLEFSESGLTNGTVYWYKVAAVNDIGTGNQSTAVSATPAVPPASATYEWHPSGFKPSKTVAELRALYASSESTWAGYTLSSLRVGSNTRLPGTIKRCIAPDQGFYPDTSKRNGTVSEGQAYTALNKAIRSNPALGSPVYQSTSKADFDAVYRFYDQHKNARGLMNWHIYDNNTPGDVNGATDGDLDMCEALRMMTVLHGDGGAINYEAEFRNLLKAIEDFEFVPETGYNYPNLMTNGDGWGFDTDNYMADYFRAAYFLEWSKWLRAHGEGLRADRWLRIYKRQYDQIEYYLNNGWTAGVPDRQTRDYKTISAYWDQVTYNSPRFFFGLMLDVLWHGSEADPRALQFCNMVANRFKTVFGTGSNVKALPYDKGLTRSEGYPNAAGYAYALSASLGSSGLQTFATELIDALAPSSDFGNNYFNGGLAVYTLAMVSGVLQPLGSGGSAPVSLPGKVVGLAVGTVTDTSIPLSWSADSKATAYVLERSSTLSGTYAVISTGSAQSYTDTGRTAGTTYYYRVKATNGNGDGSYSDVLSAKTTTPTAATPAQVTNLATGTVTATSLPLSWTASQNALTYLVERSSSLNGTYTTVATVTSTSYTDTNLSPGTTYFYRVRGSNNGTLGMVSSAVQAATLQAPPTGTAGAIKVWDGNTYVRRTLKVWDGSKWVTARARRWDGSKWVIVQ